jgi:V/A-type H+-transporting ATPase subunit A
MRDWYTENLSPTWVEDVKAAHALLHRGDEIYQMMQVTGEEGTTIEDFLTWQKSVFLDMVFLQQDAYDPVDSSMPLERQKRSFEMVKAVVEADFDIDDRDVAQDFFTRLISLYKNLNYSPDDSAEYARYLREVEDLVDSKRMKFAAAEEEANAW